MAVDNNMLYLLWDACRDCAGHQHPCPTFIGEEQKLRDDLDTKTAQAEG